MKKKIEEVAKENESKKKLNDKFKEVIGDDGIEVLDEVPKNDNSFALSTIAIILLSIATILLGTLVFVKRDAIFTRTINGDNVIDNSSKEENIDTRAVPVEDTYAFAMGEDFGIQFYVIHDGKLYYKIDDYSEIGNFQNYRVIDFNLSASYDVIKDLTLYAPLSGIKRIKSYNFADNVAYNLILIMDDGSVYRLTYTFYTNQFVLTRLNIFGDYKVDNILKLDITSECTSNNCASSYEIITKDGKNITK